VSLIYSPTVKTRSTTAPTLVGGVLQRKCACGQHTVAGGECESCQKEKTSANLRRAATNTESVNEVPPIVHEVLRFPGQPLEPSTRAFFEPRFGRHFSRLQAEAERSTSQFRVGRTETPAERAADRTAREILRGPDATANSEGGPNLGVDFSQVRVHTDSRAAESAEAVNALAYTVGRDIVFAAGQYNPRTSSGIRLLAHELTHVAQQKVDSPSLQRQPKEVDLATPETCEGKTDVTQQFSDFIRDVPSLVANTPNLPDEQRKGLNSMTQLIMSKEDSVDISKYKVLCCTKINLEIGIAGESFQAYVSAKDQEIGLGKYVYGLMGEYRRSKDKEQLTKFLQTIAHEKRHQTLAGSMKVEASTLKPGRSISAAENASYRAEEILATTEEFAVGRMALGKEYEVEVADQQKLYRLRNSIRNWVTEDEYQRLRKLIITKLRDRYGFSQGCDTSITLGVLTAMEHNHWFECNLTDGKLITKVPDGLNVCDKPGQQICHPREQSTAGKRP
jgi:hypothetical protein